jgi:hypothetical protein
MEIQLAEHTDLLPSVDLSQRIIGKFEGSRPGPNLIFFAAIHGNETSGIYALKNVLDELSETRPDFRGSFIAIAGNLKAIKENKRYLGKDLNRIWFPKTIIPREERNSIPEYREKIEILDHLIEIVDNGQPTFVFDLHTTSSHSMPFLSISDTLKNRKIIRKIPVNLVLGLEELLDGPMFSFFSEIGMPAILFEAGQHDAVSSFENHVAFIWMALCELRSIHKKRVPNYSSYVQTLRKSAPGGNKAFELKFRYLIKQDEEFRMKDGYVNFQKVEKDETLAFNQHGKIRAKRSGNIFMPLYQSQGCDGFFLIKEIKSFWFKLSSRTRKMKLDKALRLLPGISRGKMQFDGYLIDKSIARYRVISLLHLLGYRKVYDDGQMLNMSRRPYDKHFPAPNIVKQNLEAYLKLLKS